MPKTGRPSKYSQALVDELCEEIATSSVSLRSLCSGDKYPTMTTIMRWLADEDVKYDYFREQYARAREAQADVIAEEILEIADEGRNDTYKDKDGVVHVNYDHIQRSRLRVDARKWMAGKLRPKKYGERITQEVTGPDGKPVEHRWIVEAASPDDEA